MTHPLSNRELSELLALAEGREDAPHRRRALHRASRAALFWDEEAAAVAAAGRPLTELPAVGPWVERFLQEWLDDPPEVPEPPPFRQGFLTMAEVRSTPGLAEWRGAIRADLQVHTTYSDGKVPLEGMVAAAAERGHAYVGITDHSVGLPIANGMSEERLAAQAEHIARLNEDLGGDPIRVLHSIEMNLSPEGEGDMDPAALARLDLVLGTFHSDLRVKEDQTDRYLAALRNPTVHVLAHPRCRMFNRRNGLSADWPRVFAEAEGLDKAVEIDANPHRQDLDVALLEVARDAGVRISIGTDAHSVGELDFLDYGLAAALRAGIDRDRILNFAPPDDVVAWATDVRSRLAAPG
jgi:histidinol phosphatase-like PHP family hydrolase